MRGDPARLRQHAPRAPHHNPQRTAETTGGAYWTVSRHVDLAASFREVLDAVAASYLLAYEPAGVARAGRHALDVRVRRHGLHVRARQEYVVAADPPASR